MIYVYSTIFAFIYICFVTFFFDKKTELLFFEINLIIYLQKISFLFMIAFIILIEFFLIGNIIQPFLYEIFQILYFSSQTHCAGVPKLITLIDQTSLETKSSLINSYIRSEYIKEISKYGFTYLKREENFFKDRSVIYELFRINSNLDWIYNKNIEILRKKFFPNDIKNLLEENNNSHKISVLRRDLEIFYSENLYKRDLLSLYNKKLLNPLYKEFLTKTIAQENLLPVLLEFKLDKSITLDKICPFLLDKSVLSNKNINYFNICLKVNLNSKNFNLIIKEQLETISARTVDKILVENQPFISQEITENSIVKSKILLPSSNVPTVVEDITVVTKEPANGAIIPEVLEGGLGIIESLVYSIECLEKTNIQLDNANNYLIDLVKILNTKNMETPLIIENVLNETLFADSFKYRIIKETIIPDPKKIFLKNGSTDDYVLDKFKKNDTVFLTQIKRDSSMLKDIAQQKSLIKINYKKLIQDIENSNTKLQNFFDSKTIDKIKRASLGDYRQTKKIKV